MATDDVYARPRSVTAADCDFYHYMELPGTGLVEGQWDLRGHVEEYLGEVELAGKRVLEIGPASGFLLEILGFADCTVTRHRQMHRSGQYEFFTIVARRR